MSGRFGDLCLSSLIADKTLHPRCDRHDPKNRLDREQTAGELEKRHESRKAIQVLVVAPVHVLSEVPI
jgi:hypothetical protein